MTDNALSAAADAVRTAAEQSGDEDASSRLSDLAEQLDSLAAGDQMVDHGRLARIQSALDDVQTSADDDVAATIETALDEINAHRETLDGV